MKIKILIFILSTIIITTVYWEDTSCSTFSNKDSYELYKQRSNCLCNKYKSSSQIIDLSDDYKKILSAEEIEKLVWPTKKKIQELKKELKSKKIPNESNKYSGWIFDPEKTREENNKSYKEFRKNQNKEREQNKQNKKEREKYTKQIEKEKNNMYKILNWLTDKYSLSETKNIHRENMNLIYKCALLSTQKKSLLLIKNDLIKKSPTLWKRIEWKISSNINKIDNLFSSIWCSNSKTKSSILKLTVLKQATYQTCKYVSYLEYLKDHNRDIQNQFDPTKTRFTATEIAEKQIKELKRIDEEIKHTYKVFPLVFHAYTEYENNITAHFLLQLLRDDYITFREKLHKSLNPINQVVYKIVNAMKK